MVSREKPLEKFSMVKISECVHVDLKEKEEHEEENLFRTVLGRNFATALFLQLI